MIRYAIGCLGAAVIFLGIVLVGGYFLIVRPAQAFLENFQAPFSTQQQNDRATPAPAPRADVRLTQDEVRKFVRVRRAVRAEIGQDFSRYENVFQDITQGQAPGALEILGLLQQSGDVIGRARRAQEAALEREGLSAGEYANVRREVNRTLGVPEIDLQTAARSLQNFQLPDFTQVVPEPNPENRRLIEPFLDELRPTAALGLLGL